MAKVTIEITQTWQQVASGKATFTAKTVGEGTLLFNDSASDTNAYRDKPNPGNQYLEDETRDTYCRATGDGWALLVDGVL